MVQCNTTNKVRKDIDLEFFTFIQIVNMKAVLWTENSLDQLLAFTPYLQSVVFQIGDVLLENENESQSVAV